MKIEAKHRTTCRLCGSSQYELVVPLAPIPVTEKYLTKDQIQGADKGLYPLDLYQCKDCGHVQLFDVLPSEVLWDDFTFRSAQAQIVIDHLNDCAERVVKMYGIPEGSLIVDVGSNDGTLLAAFKKQGMRVLGIDPAKDIAQEANDAGIPTIPEFISRELAAKIRAEHGPAKLVLNFNAFAHADDMDEMVASIHDMMDVDGLLMFEVSYLLDIVEQMLLGAVIHEHMCHHSVKPMRSFLKKHNLEMIRVERNKMQGGSFIGIAQMFGGQLEVEPSVVNAIAEEDEKKLHEPATVRKFATKLKDLSNQFSRFKSEWTEKGATVAGYGAARSGPTLISEFKLADHIEFIFDDHPQKVNKYSPGDHIPVLPTAKILELMPEYTVILGWVHAKKIMADNMEYLRRGGKFVLYYPEVHVVSAHDFPELNEGPAV